MEAIRLVPREKHLVPPRSPGALYMDIVRKKFGILGMLKMALRAAAGRRV